MHQGGDEQELAAGLPILQTRGFEGEFGFFKAQGHFDLPPPRVQEHDAPGIFGGAIITETVFNWQGMGFLYVTALGRNDYPVAMAFLFVSAVLVVIATLLGDILYTMLDPRIRFS